MTKARERLAGSDREPVKDARRVGPTDPGETMRVVVTLRRPSQQAIDEAAQKIARGEPAEPLTREAFAARFSAAPEDLAKVEAFAKEYDLSVQRTDAAACTVMLAGTVERFQRAFGVELSHYEHPKLGRFRGRTGCILIPQELVGIVTSVLGLDDRPQARPHFRIRSGYEPRRAAARTETFTPLQMASLYDFPPGDGSGQCIGIVELGGGYTESDLRQYFSELGMAEPRVVAVGVDGGSNAPSGNPSGADGEVTLDIEIAGAVAPGATIAVYFAPNSDAGFVDAVKQAVHDSTNKPSVISISWGAPESSWTAQALTAFNQALQEAATLGVTVCAAAGDSGSNDSSAGGDSVDFPASSPYVLACGGTRVTASGSASSLSIKSEVVWNDGASGGATGGGISSEFGLPPWQEGLKATYADGTTAALTKRGVPDVAADASPASGYEVLVGGQLTAVGGTSAVAPLFAGLIARINATQGKPVGFVNAKLYAAARAFRDITQGNNGSFAAAPGWDACTGLGSPDGRKIAAALGGSATQGPSASHGIAGGT
ncbi:kumamolisin [Trinickia symbiotica]|uniref:Peptidase S53 n=1 Tax=Trinickia symbiotica TaxID=863227 RepID=A0A2N7WV50_9BURK|nr:S53 family peptidase [Trinickia symbiotica]PMS33339.1 peptidase S53 [Trinickia symbiotica]PPK42452.1 kumamolisin [Trinickia symbiotica]